MSDIIQLLDIQKFAVVDVETTGGSAQTNKIIEIAVLITDGTQILEEFQTLVNPEREIPEFISNLTQIDNSMVKNAPVFSEIAPKLYEMLGSTCFVAHNAAFDYSFVKKEFYEAGYYFNTMKFCTIKIGRKFIKLPSYRLDNLSQYFGIEIPNRHRAYGDALATTYIFHEFLKMIRRKFNEQHQLF